MPHSESLYVQGQNPTFTPSDLDRFKDVDSDKVLYLFVVYFGPISDEGISKYGQTAIGHIWQFRRRFGCQD